MWHTSRLPVSIHAPTGGATPVSIGSHLVLNVSIHAPTGGATAPHWHRLRPSSFNSRAHGGRDCGGVVFIVTTPVSIHAPTGGATWGLHDSAAKSWFQFTRPRGARLQQELWLVLYSQFQFTRPRGARRWRDMRHTYRNVSIHAPTGGATRTAHRRARRKGFNSRAHGGRDVLSGDKISAYTLFQFTRPRGARPAPSLSKEFIEVSIHAPTGGATQYWTLEARRAEFQFTRPRGARHGQGGTLGDGHAVSIHAPTGGATQTTRPIKLRPLFQFTRPRGARLPSFQPHPSLR